MEGVVLFADDQLHTDPLVSGFYQTLVSEQKYPVIAVDNLEMLQKTADSISTFKAIILDWNFVVIPPIEEGFEDVKPVTRNPEEFLENNEVFSLIYIYSDQEVENTPKGQSLRAKYKDKIEFKKKDKQKSAEDEKRDIFSKIEIFEGKYPSLKVPFIWSQTINKSVQKIFSELQNANPNWIKEIYETAKKDCVEPNSEVVSIFQHLLAELIVQDPLLQENIKSISEADLIKLQNSEESSAKLYHRIYYTKLLKTAPVMTGDIFKIDDTNFAVLITPECDISSRKATSLEFLTIVPNGYEVFLEKQHGNYKRGGLATLNKDRKSKILQIFNQEAGKFHILPSFPFSEGNYKDSACLNFSTALLHLTAAEFEGKRIAYKLNSPYIHQLRQRYLAYVGRVGVPAIPESLRVYNL